MEHLLGFSQKLNLPWCITRDFLPVMFLMETTCFKELDSACVTSFGF